MPITHKYIDAFWKRVNKKADDECWEWTGYIHPKGYGYLDTRLKKNKRTKAHRLSYEIHYPLTNEIGDIEYNVLHSCDNRACVNPYHLRLGTNDDNIKDRVSRGRPCNGYCEKASNSKLTNEQVREIRIANDLYSKPNRLYKDLATKYNISIHMISKIIRFENWLGI
jgi:hypothetical protein